MTRKTTKILGITALLIALAFFGYVKVNRFFEIDTCLDKGGHWNYETQKCELSDLTDDSNKIEWIFEKVDSTKLVFKNGKVFDTKLFQLQYIGQISVDNKFPFLIFSGVDCNQCDANSAIYIHSPSDGELIIGHGQNSYSLPGKETNFVNDSLIYEGRTFYGQVLDNKKGVIWFQKTLMKNGIWESSIFLVDISDKVKVDTFLTDNGQFAQTISLLNRGLCEEIIGQEYSSAP